MRAARTATAVDAFTAEVIRNAVVAIPREMKTNLMRTAYSSIMYEAEDCTVGLFDVDGHTISIGLGLPMSLNFLQFVAPMLRTVLTEG
jgi:N-methylhydantoinase B